MQTRKLGYSDLNLSTVGLGTWAMGGGGWQWGWGSQEDAESIAAIRRGLDLGINWVDTAAAYGLGHSEEVLAKALEGRRQEVIVATKCGMVWDENDGTASASRCASVWSAKACAASARPACAA
jgi:aryl-alcohol dehydrogenase-like predicted oxidoreductase